MLILKDCNGFCLRNLVTCILAANLLIFSLNAKSEFIISGAILMIFCLFLTWVSAGFFGVLKIWLFYQAISENYFTGHYLLILKPSLAFCLSN